MKNQTYFLDKTHLHRRIHEQTDLLEFPDSKQEQQIHSNMKNSTFLSKSLLSIVLLILFGFNISQAQNPVDSWTLTSTPATDQDSYTVGGDTYEYGQGDNIEITSVTYNGELFTIPFASQSYVFKRVDITPNADGVNVVGNKASIFYERTGASNFIYAADLPGTPGNIDLEEILKSTIINRGSLDVFKNTGDNTNDQGPSNIERIDVVFPDLTINNAADLPLNGFLASEKSGNNTYKAAAILSLDTNGEPSSYGNLVTIWSNNDPSGPSYGIPADNTFNPLRSNAFIEDSNSNNEPIRVGGANERIGLSIITFADLGITAGQTFYGISFFGDDVVDTDNLLDPTTFPDNTGTGADIYGALGAIVTATGFIPPSDNDNDLVIDSIDLDDDNDGILDSVELACNNGFENISAAAVNSSINNITLHDGSSTAQTLTQAFTTPGCTPNQDIVSYKVTAYPSQLASNTTNICADVDSFQGFTNGNGDNIALDKSGGCDGGIRYRIEFISGAEIIDLTSLSHGNLASDEAIVITSNVILTGQSFKRATADASNSGTNGGPTVTGSGSTSVTFDNVSGAFGGNLNIWEVNSNGVAADWIEIDYYRSGGGTGESYEAFTLNHILPCDNDCDGLANYLDLDSDNDGIPDTVEAQPTGNYNAPGAVDPATGIPAIGTDLDGITPENSDGTDSPDYIDLDSDNDGLFDIVESGNGALDTDMSGRTNDPVGNNGLTNTVDNEDDFTDPDGTLNDPTTLPNAQYAVTSEVDYRETPDSDNDGILDSVDLDDDNDGIPDLEEGVSCITTTNLNSQNLPIDTDLTGGATNSVTLSGLDNGVFDFTADLNGTANWADGIQIQNNTAIGDFLFAQPQGTGNTSGANGATYTFDFPTPVKGFSFVVGGLNNNDQVTITAFNGLTPVIITPENFSGLDNGIVVSSNSVQGTRIDNNFDPLIHIFSTYIPEVIDRIVIKSGKADNNTAQVTVGFYSFGYCIADANADFDGDGIPNAIDLDSDNDGITDLIEAGGTDSNNDGEVDYQTPGDPTTLVDTNMNGLDDTLEGTPLILANSDALGGTNFLDIDADDDGIPDNVEGQTTAGYIPPSGIGTAMNDTNSNGLDDVYETAGTLGISPVNTDASFPNADTIPDYIDHDTDGDGINDLDENGDTDINLSVDADNDGLDDAFDDFDDSAITGSTVNDGINPPNAANLGDEDSNLNTGGDVDYRDFIDNDRDAILDSVDLDDDNDGIPDSVEGDNDFDNDGIKDSFDLDSDNDGIADITEAGGIDDDGNGLVDTFTDLDNDGLHDPLDNIDGGVSGSEVLDGTPLANPNTDGDAFDNRIDIDADNDGLPDNIEAQTTVGYVPPNGTYLPNGFDTAYPIALTPINTDTDTRIPDYIDIDSDDDGIDDIIEGGRGNFLDIDTDGDGLDDGFEGATVNDRYDVNDEIEDPTTLPDDQLPGDDVDYRDAALPASTIDTDGDGVLDVQEDLDGTDSNDPCDFVIASITEIQSGAYRLADCDGDGVVNEIEILDETNPEDPCDFVAANITEELSGDYLISDCDGDGVTNGTEIADGTDPTNPCESVIANITLDQSGEWISADCDGDTIPNGQEITDGTDPYDPCSSIGGTPPADADCDTTVTIESDLVSPDLNGGIFQINNIEFHPTNTVKIFNRWGVLVFETADYNNSSRAFRGISNGRATVSSEKELPVGVYFYIIEYVDEGKTSVMNGYLYVNR